jgi:hypothetical protein
LGRFIELDPIGFEAGDNNWYRFVANGPTGKTDPSGLQVVAGTHSWAPQLDTRYRPPNPAGLRDGIPGYDIRIKFTVPEDVPYTPVRVLQVNKITWTGVTASCRFKSGTEYIVDLPGTYNAGNFVPDHLYMPPPGEKYCVYFRVVEKTIGIGEKGKVINGVGRNEESYLFVKSRLRDPIATLTYAYFYINTDNCNCCPLVDSFIQLTGSKRTEGISMPGVGRGRWSETF